MHLDVEQCSSICYINLRLNKDETMKTLLFIITMYILTTVAQANDAEQCIYGLYNQDNNELIIESDSKEYLESIERDYQDESMNETTLIELSYCEGV